MNELILQDVKVLLCKITADNWRVEKSELPAPSMCLLLFHLLTNTQRWLADNWLVWILWALAHDDCSCRSSLPRRLYLWSIASLILLSLNALFLSFAVIFLLFQIIVQHFVVCVLGPDFPGSTLNSLFRNENNPQWTGLMLKWWNRSKDLKW